jgi:hypothetical protein
MSTNFKEIRRMLQTSVSDPTITFAKQSRFSVLISAPKERAVAIAHAIIEGASEVVLVIREVHALSYLEQMALLHLLDTLDDNRRVITTTSSDLFEHVVRGAFSSELFYKLNTLHIAVGDES